MANETAKLRVFRYDPDQDAEPRYDCYEIPAREGLTVLEALFYILEHVDPSLAFRYACRGAVCGSCAMYINGSYKLACGTQVSSYKGKEIVINPLPHLQVVKDLVVDMAPFFAKYEAIRPYLINNTPPPEKEWPQSPRERKRIDEMIDCILCACCYSSCPSVWMDPEYKGPAALLKANRFNVDTRDRGAGDRMPVLDDEDGLWRCHTIFNCVEACPKDINVTSAIQTAKRTAVKRKLGLRRRDG
jgi:succinate dehydrogenase / fumarate reductase iron-sulfur subunit